MMKNTVRLLKQ